MKLKELSLEELLNKEIIVNNFALKSWNANCYDLDFTNRIMKMFGEYEVDYVCNQQVQIHEPVDQQEIEVTSCDLFTGLGYQIYKGNELITLTKNANNRFIINLRYKTYYKYLDHNIRFKEHQALSLLFKELNW